MQILLNFRQNSTLKQIFAGKVPFVAMGAGWPILPDRQACQL